MPVAHVGLSRGPRPFPNGFRTGRSASVPVVPVVVIRTGPLVTVWSGVVRDVVRADGRRVSAVSGVARRTRVAEVRTTA